MYQQNGWQEEQHLQLLQQQWQVLDIYIYFIKQENKK